MNLFKQLLVAPAVLGLVAPVAATAAELNNIGVSGNSDSFGEVASAPLQNRVDELEDVASDFEAGVFSSGVTTMSGTTNFVVGGYEKDGGKNQDDGAITFTYSTQLNINSSFFGDDLLYTRIKAGNFDNSAFASKTYGNYLSATHSSGNTVEVDKIWYQFPIGDSVTAWVGPKIENYYMLASSPSIYKPVQKQFALGGNAGAYAASTDGGFGLAWVQQVEDVLTPRWAVSTNYVSKGATSPAEDGGGIFAKDTQSKWLTKLEYGSPRWQVSAAVAKEYCNYTDPDGDLRGNYDDCKNWQAYYATEKGADAGTGDATAYSIRAYWRPDNLDHRGSQSKAPFPFSFTAIQVGFDLKNIDDDNDDGDIEQTSGWMTGLMWDDLVWDGNRLGFAIGQRSHATKVHDQDEGNDDDAKNNLVWEVYYDIKVQDRVTVTPAIFGGRDTFDGDDDDTFGGLVKTTFKF